MRALRHRDFRLLWGGMLLQATGNWIQQIAVSWLVLELTDSPLMLGVVSFFQAVPYLVFALWGGALADRFNRRLLLQTSQVLNAVVAVVPAVLVVTGVVEVWHLFLVSALISAIAGIDGPARQALAPSLVPRGDLMTAVALMSVVRRGTALIGPMTGGFIIAAGGTAGAFGLSAVFAVGMFVATALIRTPPVDLGKQHASVARSIANGISYVGSQPILRATFIIESLTQGLIMYVGILPVFARDVLNVGPEGLGLLYAAPGVGALIASALMASRGEVVQKGRFYTVTAFAKTAIVVVFALSTSMPLSLAMLALFGFVDVMGGTVRVTMLQTITHERMRGRIMSLDNLAHKGLGTLSGVHLGAAANFIGAPLAMLIGVGIVLSFATHQLFRVPQLARYRDGDIEVSEPHTATDHIEPPAGTRRAPAEPEPVGVRSSRAPTV